MKLYRAVTELLNSCLELGMPTHSMLTTNSSGNVTIAYASTYIFNSILAAGFALLKLNYSFLGQHGLDTDSAKDMFRKTVFALRSMSASENDLAERLAEVLAQVWLSGRVRAEPDEDNIGIGDSDDSLRLKVRCRMSMSIVFDSVWRWRQHFQLKGKSLDGMLNIHRSTWAMNLTPCEIAYLQNPTDPAATFNNSSASSNVAGDTRNTMMSTDPSLAPSASIMSGMTNMANASTYSGYGTGYGESNYEVFDPLNWMLDGLVDFPYSFTAMQGLEQQGLGVGDDNNL